MSYTNVTVKSNGRTGGIYVDRKKQKKVEMVLVHVYRESLSSRCFAEGG